MSLLHTLTAVWKTWRASRTAGQRLDELMTSLDPDAPLAERNRWLVELAHWIGRARLPVDASDIAGSAPRSATEAVHARRFAQHARIRYLLNVLERNPEWKTRFAQLVRATLGELDSIALLCDTGMPTHPGFRGAFWERVQAAVIPPAVSTRDLSALTRLMFPPNGAPTEWIEELPLPLLTQLHELIGTPDKPDDASVHANAPAGQSVRRSMALRTALQNLVYQISSTGLSQPIRVRLQEKRISHLPFFQLPPALQDVVAADDDGTGDAARLRGAINYLRVVLDQCAQACRDVYAHLDENGVSVEIVFQVERMRSRIERAEQLLEAWLAPQDHRTMARLFANLVKANRASQSAMHLVRSNFALLARKLCERNAETGEHYIAHDRAEYASMLKMAAGGGIVTAATVYLKFFIVGAQLPHTLEGWLAGLNYAASFLLMHFLHFTLATKQPAMTAPAIAHKLDGVRRPDGLEDFTASIVALMRTQAAAIFGNVMLVLPVCWLAQWVAAHALGVNLISPHKAHATLQSFSILGPTPFYAALTGVLLWISSLVAGWADNWFALHRIADVIAYHRRLRFIVGQRRAFAIAAFWQRNCSGIVGNVSLGLMLGIVPVVVGTFLFPFEVRHVTLSAGSIGAALGVLGSDTPLPELGLAAAGVLSMAVLNVGVSFALAFNMAVRSRELPRTDRRQLTRAVWQRVLANPLCLLFPLALKARHHDGDGDAGQGGTVGGK